jgi:hypothetical protein
MQGGCLCGKVRYQITQLSDNIANCFCEMCQKSSGSAFATFAAVDHDHLQWLQGQASIKEYQSSHIASRGFCQECGCNLYYRVAQTGSPYEIALGTLDQEPAQKPNANIYCESKREWAKEVEQLPSFNQGRQ